MKLKKVLSSILIILGCIMMLIGLLAFALPRINNQQLQLVLSSFESPSENPVIQFMNDGTRTTISEDTLCKKGMPGTRPPNWV
jgi:hypothetical protein